jgi:hypothetical protein
MAAFHDDIRKPLLFDFKCCAIDPYVEQFQREMICILDRHAPLKVKSLHWVGITADDCQRRRERLSGSAAEWKGEPWRLETNTHMARRDMMLEKPSRDHGQPT